MESSMKTGALSLLFLFLASCTSAPERTQPTVTMRVDTLAPTETPKPTLTPAPTQTHVPIQTATLTPWPTKDVLAQFGVFGGDGGWDYFAFIGGDMPKWILYTDGQFIVQKEDDSGVWFEETTLTVPQMCSFLSQIENAGFFTLAYDDSSASVAGIPTANPIYKFDNTTQFGEGGSDFILQINGPIHRQIPVYHSYVQYLIPEAKQVFNLFNNYSPPSRLTEYQPQLLLLRIEKGLGDFAHATPAPIIQTWPADLPSLEELEKKNIETEASPYLSSEFSLAMITDEMVKPIFEAFGNRLAYSLFQGGDQAYYVVARPLLPHETLNDFSDFPREEEFDLPFSCSN
jgi:hypothetical protein